MSSIIARKPAECAADVLCRRVNGPDCPFEEDTPRFDPVRRTFSYAGRVLRQFRKKAENQEKILQAFEIAGWPRRIENPFGRSNLWDPQHRLSNTVSNLKRHQKPAKRVRFWVEKGTQAVCWEPIDEDSGHHR